jgi:hypothetical protein
MGGVMASVLIRALTVVGLVSVTGIVQAQSGAPQQQQPAAQQRDDAPQSQAERKKPAEQSGAQARQPTEQPVEGAPVETRDYSPERQEPQPPNQVALEDVQNTRNAEVAVDAGVGSRIAYASATVVELGGSLALTHQSDTTIFRIAPSVGYFVDDNIEFTLFPELSIVDVSGETDVVFGALLEPSYHAPFSESLFGFLGIGVGLRYSDDPGFDFALRPRLGMDIMIGRSGILKPAAFLDIGANDGLNAGGFEAGFTVML